MYGHLTGDEVIRQLAQHLKAITNEKTLCFRYGGEEFGILIREVNVDEVYSIAECLRLIVVEGPGPTGVPVTISLGISNYQTDDDSPTPIIERADTALYQSKLDGRNRTTVFGLDKDRNQNSACHHPDFVKLIRQYSGSDRHFFFDCAGRKDRFFRFSWT